MNLILFQVGDRLNYNLHGYVDSRGHLVTTGERSNGAWSTMDSTVAVLCTDQDATSYLFAMNMWDTVVNVGQGPASGASRDTGKEVILGDNKWLGPDMYFQQLKTGEIVQV